MSISFWLNLIVCLGSLFVAWLDHGDTLAAFRSAQTGRRRIGLKLAFLWGVPTVSLIATVIAGWESIAADKDWTETRSLATNAIKKASNLDIRKQRIASVTANVELSVGPTKTREWSNPLDDGGVASLSVGRADIGPKRGLWTLKLVADKYMRFGGFTESAPSQFFLNFRMSAVHPNWNLKDDLVESVDEWNALSINAFFLGDEVEVLGGSVTITVNSIVQKTLVIPPQQPHHLPVITAINTNGFMSSFDTGQGGRGSAHVPIPTK